MVVDIRDGIHQTNGIGVLGIIEESPGGGLFHDVSGVHHRHLVGHFGNDAQVVGDDDNGHMELFLQVLQKLQDLGLDGHIQGRSGLVGNQQLRISGQGHGDHDPLAHTAGKLMGVFVHPLPCLGNANQLQQLNGPVPGGLFVQALVELQGLRNLIPDGKYRVQGGHGLLENHGDPVAPELPHFLFGQGQKVLAVKDDAAALVPAGGRIHQTHDRQAGDAFAAAGFTHNAQCLSLVQGKGDAVHRLGNTGIGVEIGFQVFYFQQTHGTPPYPMWISYGVWDRFSMPDWVTSTSSSMRTPQSPGK